MKSSSRIAAFSVLIGTIPVPATRAAVDFVKDVQPILENNCVSCHNEKQAKGGVRLHTLKQALTSGDNGASLVPGKSAKSPLYTTMVLPEDDDLLMPPKKKGGPLPKEMSDLIRKWIDEGAAWPADLVLVSKKKEEASKVDETALVEDIHKRIIAQSPATEAGAMRPYTEKIAGTDVVFDLVAIPGGKYNMGSPESESGRSADEGPQRPVELNELTDASARPTQPYVEMSFGMGKDGYPAISMTQHAANKYCEWLSAKTGHFYRLPTEAEWEYAARAGTTTAYFWGDDPAQIDEYCWWGDNSNGKYQKVGKKKPNPWGLHDILGNVMEWTLDQYAPETYAGGAAKNPWVVATKPYPHVARGGAWDADSADKLRVAARRFSDPDWKIQDPQFPKSVWYHTDAQFLGFRVVRPLETPSAADMKKIWNSGVEKD
ncbi:MAG: hypothetical protein EBS01_03295 [Verrucomicrobia bacterium]|nr:hypothetical protein [Verrucomicrobiota bacterium]